jgi:hypothetical protein
MSIWECQCERYSESVTNHKCAIIVAETDVTQTVETTDSSLNNILHKMSSFYPISRFQKSDNVSKRIFTYWKLTITSTKASSSHRYQK